MIWLCDAWSFDGPPHDYFLGYLYALDFYYVMRNAKSSMQLCTQRPRLGRTLREVDLNLRYNRAKHDASVASAVDKISSQGDLYGIAQDLP